LRQEQYLIPLVVALLTESKVLSLDWLSKLSLVKNWKSVVAIIVIIIGQLSAVLKPETAPYTLFTIILLFFLAKTILQRNDDNSAVDEAVFYLEGHIQGMKSYLHDIESRIENAVNEETRTVLTQVLHDVTGRLKMLKEVYKKVKKRKSSKKA
jgi:hypothetical protein